MDIRDGLWYVVGLLSLIFSVIFILFSFYMLPHLLWGWSYELPFFLLWCEDWLGAYYSLPPKTVTLVMFSALFFSGLLLGLIATWSSHKMDEQTLPQEPEELKEKVMKQENRLQGTDTFLRIFLACMAIVGGFVIIDWAVTT
ncbi:MAG: hypothetical protein Q8R79_07535 [Legionellaceae bacterium]|nr:hypothetical protein [Legionellaceae bacterium]